MMRGDGSILGRLAGWGAALVVSAGLAVSPAVAQQPELIAENEDWAGFVFQEDGNDVCYMASQPTTEEGDYTQRGDVFALVTHRPHLDQTNVLSIQAGYTYDEGAEVEVQIGNESWTLYAEGDTAWAPVEESDAIVQAMRDGLTMTVRGRSEFDTLTTDTYSLRGVRATHDAISEACGVG